MCNHAIAFARQDTTAYITLQEGVEHANKIDKHTSKRTIGPISIAGTGTSGWQQILDAHQIRRRLFQKYPELSSNNDLSHVNIVGNQVWEVRPVINIPMI